MERNVEPVIAKGFYAARNICGGQYSLMGKAADARRIPLTKLAQLQRGALELLHGPLQRFLQLVGVHLRTIGQRHQ